MKDYHFADTRFGGQIHGPEDIVHRWRDVLIMDPACQPDTGDLVQCRRSLLQLVCPTGNHAHQHQDEYGRYFRYRRLRPNTFVTRPSGGNVHYQADRSIRHYGT